MQDNETTNWYTIKVQNNYEAKVADRIRLEMERAQKKVNIVIPKERIITVKDGKKKPKEKMMFPGYIFAETVNLGELMNIVRFTTGATNILSTREEKIPIPLKRSEVKQMLLAEEKLKEPISEDLYIPGQSVKILLGVWEGWNGTVDSIDYEKKEIKISVPFLNKNTIISLGFEDITKA